MWPGFDPEDGPQGLRRCSMGRYRLHSNPRAIGQQLGIPMQNAFLATKQNFSLPRRHRTSS